MKACTCTLVCILVSFSSSVTSAGVIFQWESPSSGNWNAPAAWSPDGVPGTSANDTARILAAGSPYTVTLNVNPGNALDEFELDGKDSTFVANGKTLTVDGPSLLTDAAVTWLGSTWTGSGTLTNNAAMTILGSSTISTTGFAQNGSLLIEGNSTGSHAKLTSANGFVNSGTLTMQSSGGGYSSTLDVTTGALTNAATGTININVGAGGDRTVRANLTNNGTVNFNTNTSFFKTSGVYTNNHLMNIAANKAVTISSFDQTFNQNGGTLDIDGALNLYYMTVNYNGGTIMGTPTLINASLSIAPTAANPASFLIGGSNNNLIGNINGGQLVTLEGNSTGSHARLASANGFVNSGTLTMQSSGGGYSSTLDVTTGALTNAATGTININVGAGGDRTVRASLTNNGTVNINTNTSFSKTSGVYTNNHLMNIAANKTLAISSNDQTFNQNGGTLDIDGALNLYYMAVNYNGGTILGTPTLINSSLSIAPTAANPASFLIGGGNNNLIGNINGGQLVTVEGNSTGSHAKLTSANGFVNSGTLTMQSSNGGYSSTLDVTTGDLTNAATGTININVGAGGDRTVRASLTNNGTVNINTNTSFSKTSGAYTNNHLMNIAANKAVTISSFDQTFNQNGGTLDIDGALNLYYMAVNYNGGTILGTPTLINSSLSIAPSAANPASFLIGGGNNHLIGNINGGQLVTLEGNSTGSHARLTSANGFVNSGTLTMQSSNGGYSSTLDVTTGDLTNATTGTININVGAGGNRAVRANLANNGTVHWNASGTLGTTGATHVNRGDFIIANSASTTVTGTSFINAPGGTIAGSGVFNVDTVAFTNDGKVSPGLSPGILTVDGTYNQSTSGSLYIELGGLVVGADYDRLDVDGTANLGGTLDISLLGAFVPDPGDTFVILTATDVDGFFSNAETVVAFNGGTFDVQYLDTSVTLSAYQVPEPATLSLLALGGLAMLRRRK